MAKYNPLTKHHRKPKSMQGGNNRENISIVPENKHAAYHLLFNEGRVDYIVKVLNNTWIDPEYELFFRRKEKPVEACKHLKGGCSYLVACKRNRHPTIMVGFSFP